MGFTRYWKVKNDLDTNAFRRAASDVRTMLKGSGAWGQAVKWESDSTKLPACDVRGIRFNGVGEEGHETFGFFPFETEFDFCKTACKTYDVYVYATLLILKHHFPCGIEISSDGEGRNDEAAQALATMYTLYKKTA